MDAHKLRIGNLFQEQNTKDVIMVTELSQFKIGFSGSFKGEWQAKPIPLTEEWLIEKMKFHKQNNQIYSIGLKLFISWWNTNSIEIDINGEVLIINCKYVHELQNIYFALTGEELELKVDALQ